MIRKFITAFAALSLAACAPGAFGGVNSPAPLEQTTIDDKGLETAWKTFDVALDAINLLGDLNYIVPGSPRGVAVAAAIRKVNTALSAAERFAAAGSTTNYAAALTDAAAGLAEIRTVIGSK